uniref:Uncharacterized protein n=1 Tax=Glossina morsitans morsitans TaxID=37546 RepID=A0A1B0GA42_GLOMM
MYEKNIRNQNEWIEQYSTTFDTLKCHGIQFDLHDQTRMEPTDESVSQAEAIGGGSSIDTGRRANVPMVNLFTVYVLNTVWSMMSDKRYDRKSEEIDDLLKMFFELFQHVDMVGANIQSLSHNEFYSTLRFA